MDIKWVKQEPLELLRMGWNPLRQIKIHVIFHLLKSTTFNNSVLQEKILFTMELDSHLAQRAEQRGGSSRSNKSCGTSCQVNLQKMMASKSSSTALCHVDFASTKEYDCCFTPTLLNLLKICILVYFNPELCKEGEFWACSSSQARHAQYKLPTL